MWGIVGEYMGVVTVKALQSVLSGFVGDTKLHRIGPWLQQRFDPEVQRRMNSLLGPVSDTSLPFILLSEYVSSDSNSDSDTN